MVSSAINFKIFVTGLGDIEKPSIILVSNAKVGFVAWAAISKAPSCESFGAELLNK